MLLFSGMQTALRRQRPRLVGVAGDVPQWLADAASRSVPMRRNYRTTQSRVVWLPLVLESDDVTLSGGAIGEQLGSLTLCSELLTGYSHDVRC